MGSLVCGYGLVFGGVFLIELWRAVSFLWPLGLPWSRSLATLGQWLLVSAPIGLVTALAVGSLLAWALASSGLERRRRVSGASAMRVLRLIDGALLAAVVGLSLAVSITSVAGAERALAELKIGALRAFSAEAESARALSSTDQGREVVRQQLEPGSKPDGQSLAMLARHQRLAWALLPLALAWLGWQIGRTWPDTGWKRLLMLTLAVAASLSIWDELSRYLWREVVMTRALPWLSLVAATMVAAGLSARVRPSAPPSAEPRRGSTG